jgi:hypothetical protein
MHKIVQYPFGADTTQQITTSLKLISLQMPDGCRLCHLFSQASARCAFEATRLNEPTSQQPFCEKNSC